MPMYTAVERVSTFWVASSCASCPRCCSCFTTASCPVSPPGAAAAAAAALLGLLGWRLPRLTDCCAVSESWEAACKT